MKMHSILGLTILLAAAPVFASGELLVGNKSDDTVWRLSLDDGRKLGEVASGQGPHEIAVARERGIALVTDYGRGQAGRSLTVIDTGSGGKTRTIDLGAHPHPHGVRLLPGDTQALVTTEGSGSLLLVDIVNGAVERVIDVGDGLGHMVALSHDAKTAYVSKIGAGTVSRIDLGDGRKTKEAKAGRGAEGIEIAPDGAVWVTNRAEDTVTVHAPDTLAIRDTLRSEGFPVRVAFTADGGHALVTNAKAATLSVFNAKTRKAVASVALAPKDVAFKDTLLGKDALPIGVIADPSRPRVYVAISGADRIAVVDSATWKVIDYWKTGTEPDALGIVPAGD